MDESTIEKVGELMNDHIESIVKRLVQTGASQYAPKSAFEELISFGELIDRLSIVNIKLYLLKDEVEKRKNDKDEETAKFLAWQAVEDIRLVMERARLKRAIDEKMLGIVGRVVAGQTTGGFNPETKKYGGTG
jgi:dienelactone hydrolase